MQDIHRVVITGIGIIAPNGIGTERFWNGILEQRSGIGTIKLFDASSFPSRIAGEVKGFDPQEFIEARFKPRRMARHTQFAIAASVMALAENDNLEQIKLHPPPIPVVLGVSFSGLEVIENQVNLLNRRGPERVSPFGIQASTPHAISRTLSDQLDVHTDILTISSGCVSGTEAITRAFNLIRSGQADVAITGASDATITPVSMASFATAGLASMQNEKPQQASRPFDAKRDSGVIAEGGAILLLENYESAKARDAHIYAEIRSTGHYLDPAGQPAGTGLREAMQAALENACIQPHRIDYISAHGPGHPLLDQVETDMIKQVFREAAHRTPVSSIKGVIGNPMSAAGPMQVAATALALDQGIIPPTANYRHRDPGCDLDYVGEGPRKAKLDYCLVNSHALHGSNTCLVMQRVDAT